MNRTLSCLIVDDEPIAQEIIEKHIRKAPFLHFLAKCDNAIDALEIVRDQQPDLIFLDVKMPEMTGLELLEIISHQRPQVILTTAYPDYALRGFELEVSNYLLKPISFDRFLSAANKAYELEKLKSKAGLFSSMTNPVKSNEENGFFWVKQDKRLIRINEKEIIFIKSMKDYVQFFLPSRNIMTYITMAKIEQKLPASEFMRISRSCMVRKAAIKTINGNVVETENGERLIIGTTYKEKIKKEIGEWLK